MKQPTMTGHKLAEPHDVDSAAELMRSELTRELVGLATRFGLSRCSVGVGKVELAVRAASGTACQACGSVGTGWVVETAKVAGHLSGAVWFCTACYDQTYR